jgi:hypothetical protein
VIENWKNLEQTNVNIVSYWKEIALLICALFIPFVSWYLWHDPDILSASGSLMIFCSVLAEFSLLHKLNVKHINNALRVKAGGMPKRFSKISQIISALSLIIALSGTIIWGYGNRIFS